MKFEWRLMAGLGLFLAPFTALYWFTSYEVAGSLLLAGLVVGPLLLGVYLATVARKVGVRPEDRLEATMADGAGSVGTFPAPSGWPAVIALGAAQSAIGLALNGWLAVPGVALLLAGMVGLAGRTSTRP